MEESKEKVVSPLAKMQQKFTRLIRQASNRNSSEDDIPDSHHSECTPPNLDDNFDHNSDMDTFQLDPQTEAYIQAAVAKERELQLEIVDMLKSDLERKKAELLIRDQQIESRDDEIRQLKLQLANLTKTPPATTFPNTTVTAIHGSSLDNARRLDQIEQELKQYSVRISGFEPPSIQENETPAAIKPSEIVCDIAREIGVEISRSDIDMSHFNSKPDQDGRRQILVKFLRFEDKLEFIKARKRLRGSATYKSVYLNEDLTRTRYQILKSLIQLKKDKVIHSAWSMNGDLYYKKSETGRPVKVDDVIGFNSTQITT